jgi:hypothetical protein
MVLVEPLTCRWFLRNSSQVSPIKLEFLQGSAVAAVYLQSALVYPTLMAAHEITHLLHRQQGQSGTHFTCLVPTL